MIEREFEFNGLFYIPISSSGPLHDYKTNRDEHLKDKDRTNVSRIVYFLQQRHFNTFFSVGNKDGHDMLTDYESVELLGLGSPEAMAYTIPEFNREIHKQGRVINGDGKGFSIQGAFIEDVGTKIKLKPFGNFFSQAWNFFPSDITLRLSSDRTSLNQIERNIESLQIA